MRSYAVSTDAQGLRFGIVVSRFNHEVAHKLLQGCAAFLEAQGARADDLHLAWVPGAFEIPLAARRLAESGRYDALIALGAVIRGGTPHFDYICAGVSDGVREVMRDTGCPVAFGVLTVNDIAQALERAGGSAGDKGAEAARTAIEMAQLCRVLDAPPAAEAEPSK